MLNAHLHYPLPADIDQPLNDAAAEYIRDYRPDHVTTTVPLFLFLS